MRLNQHAVMKLLILLGYVFFLFYTLQVSVNLVLSLLVVITLIIALYTHHKYRVDLLQEPVRQAYEN